MSLRSLSVALVVFVPAVLMAQETAPTANAPQGAPPVSPAPAPDTVAGPGKDLQAARKAIMDRMRECMKNASTREAKKACRDEMRKSREAIHEEKRANAPREKKKN